MFDNLKKLNRLKERLKEFENDCIDEINACEEFLKDLPEDIEDIKEFDEVILNNKDLSRAYDLGRKEAFEEAVRKLKS